MPQPPSPTGSCKPTTVYELLPAIQTPRESMTISSQHLAYAAGYLHLS